MKTKGKFKKILMALLIIAIILLSAVLIWVLSCINEVRNISTDLNKANNKYVYIIDDLGNTKKISQSTHNDIKINNLNDYTMNAFLSIEDKTFYSHNGINLKRIAKSMLDNISSKKIVAGGSTITQQLVKNKFLSNDKTLKRKVQEIYLARKIESKYDKDDILESYLNSIYFGSGAYGIENASNRYFGKSAKELTLNESCVLASTINSPSLYSPILNMDNCTERKNLILREMYKDGNITKEEYEKNIDEEIMLNVKSIDSLKDFDLYDRFAINEACEILDMTEDEIFNEHLKIYTGKNSATQTMLESIINDESFYEKNSSGNIADSLGMIIDNSTNLISAVAGKSEYDLVGLKRQPGSLIKPVLVYAPAMEEGLINPMTKILDNKVDYSGYSPNDVGGISNDYVSIETAISKSLNVPAVKVCNMLGLNKCKNYAQKCGLNFDEKDTGLSLALGGTTNGFTLQNILDSYSTLNFNGNYIKSNFINKIQNDMFLTLYSRKMTESNIFCDDTAYLMTEMLIKSTHNGTSKKLTNLPYQIAGKTGTVGVKNSNQNTDAYSMGYTTKNRVAIWLGNYSMKSEYNLEGSNNGGTYATAMLKEVFEGLYKDEYPDDFTMPKSVTSCDIDAIKLEEENKVYRASDSMPDRYKVSGLFSTRFLPEYSSDYYDDSLTVSATSNDNKNIINFDTNKYCTYTLYREYDGTKKILSSYKNKTQNISFEDSDIISNKKYSYYVLCDNILTGKSFKSNVVTLYTNFSQNDTSIDDTTDYAWLFG